MDEDEIGDAGVMMETRLDEESLEALAERLEALPLEQAEWVAVLFAECRRARAAESRLDARARDTTAQLQDIEHDLGQIALDAAEWLRTLWKEGYMGASHFPAKPRSDFPAVELEDVLKSSLFARIRQGKRPLPFPPPTRHGNPWHEVVEAEAPFPVTAEVVRDEAGKVCGAIIDACAHWRVLGEQGAGVYRVQHRGKGPLYRLAIGAQGAMLSREPPDRKVPIRTEDRAGVRLFVLEWPEANGSVREVPLRAASWERAESEAQHWLARAHPESYGQVRFVARA